jgi:cholesterol transport system auxiliary component
MKIKYPTSAVCAALILGACAIGKPIPRATTYIIEPTPPASTTAARQADTLRMGYVRVAASFAGNSLVYRVDDVQYISDPYHAFIADPAAMLGNRMADWLDQAGPFKAVAQPGSLQSAKSAPYVLEATVTELYGDTRTGMPPAAVMTIQFALLDTTGPRPVTAYQRTISRRVQIEQATPDALVRGYGTVLSEILSQVRSDLASLPVGQRG